MSGKTRGDLLADLATAINELTEPRHHTEYLIKTVTTEVPSTDGRRRKGKAMLLMAAAVGIAILSGLRLIVGTLLAFGTQVFAAATGVFASVEMWRTHGDTELLWLAIVWLAVIYLEVANRRDRR